MLAMLKPIAPFVEYALNYDYISKVLCINKDKPEMRCKGACQLMKKLQQQEDNEYQSLRVHMEEYPIGFVDFLTIDFSAFKNKILIEHSDYKNRYCHLYSKSVFHPPII